VAMLDGVQGGNRGVMVLRDGPMRGGDSMRRPKATALRSPASRAFDSNRGCVC
jgi:hypothetical protein